MSYCSGLNSSSTTLKFGLNLNFSMRFEMRFAVHINIRSAPTCMLKSDVNIFSKTLDCPSFNTQKTNCSQSVSNEVSLDVYSIQNVSSLETGIFLRDTFHRPAWSNDKIKDNHANWRVESLSFNAHAGGLCVQLW